MTTPLTNKPKITQTDINNGYVTRYFVRHVSAKVVTEVDKKQYDTFKQNTLYETVDFPWLITGLANDTLSSDGTIIYGTKHKNTVTTAFYNKKMPGLTRLLSNPLDGFQGVRNPELVVPNPTPTYSSTSTGVGRVADNFRFTPPAAPAPTPDLITASLVFYVDAADTDSYPTSGLIWYDVSGNTINGSFSDNGPTYSSNPGSIVFDGVDDYVGFGSDSRLSFASDFTIHAWIYPTAAPASAATVVSKRNAFTFVNNYQFFINENLLLVFQVNDSLGNSTQTFSGIAPLNTWTCMTAVKSGSMMLVYDDTVLVASSPAPPGPITDLGAPLRIGQNHDFNRPFTGKISNVMLYNRALSQSEIQQNFNSIKSRFGL